MNYLFKDRQTSPSFGGIPATLLEMGKKLFSCEINGILVALLLKNMEPD
jgi:hypothetical protein